MNPIVINAHLLLKIMIGLPEDEWLTKGAVGRVGVRNSRLHELSALSPEDINNGIEWLEDQGALVLLAKNLGDAPYTFRWVKEITARGKFLFHELEEQTQLEKGDVRLDGVTDENVNEHSRLVLSLHGIRTRGEWQKRLNSALNRAGFIHEPLDYGFFRAIRLTLPFLRKKQVEWFLGEYTHMCERHNCERMSIIAHSFGTYLVATTMASYPEVKFDRIILVGSIIPPSYSWTNRRKAGQFNSVLTQCAKRDRIVKLAAWATDDAGPSGAEGFQDNAGGLILERTNSELGHSGYFYELNYKNNWIPFLQAKEIGEGSDGNPGSVNWRFQIIKWVLIILVIASLALVFWKVKAGFNSTDVPQGLTEQQKKDLAYNLEAAVWCREHNRPQQALMYYREAQKIVGDDRKILEAIDALQKQLGGDSK